MVLTLGYGEKLVMVGPWCPRGPVYAGPDMLVKKPSTGVSPRMDSDRETGLGALPAGDTALTSIGPSGYTPGILAEGVYEKSLDLGPVGPLIGGLR